MVREQNGEVRRVLPALLSIKQVFLIRAVPDGAAIYDLDGTAKATAQAGLKLPGDRFFVAHHERLDEGVSKRQYPKGGRGLRMRPRRTAKTQVIDHEVGSIVTAHVGHVPARLLSPAEQRIVFGVAVSLDLLLAPRLGSGDETQPGLGAEQRDAQAQSEQKKVSGPGPKGAQQLFPSPFSNDRRRPGLQRVFRGFIPGHIDRGALGSRREVDHRFWSVGTARGLAVHERKSFRLLKH